MTSQPQTCDGARLTTYDADRWCRLLEDTGAVWAVPLGLGGAGALIELRGRARPRPLVGVLRTPGECRVAREALRAAPGAADPAAALPPALRCAPGLWRERAAALEVGPEGMRAQAPWGGSPPGGVPGEGPR
jgi:hypothetical protein